MNVLLVNQLRVSFALTATKLSLVLSSPLAHITMNVLGITSCNTRSATTKTIWQKSLNRIADAKGSKGSKHSNARPSGTAFFFY